MKKIIYSLTLVLMMFLSACQDETSQDTSVITYYPTLVLEGDATVIWSQGVDFVDPGYSAEVKGEDVTDKVVVSGSVNVNAPGVYELTYDIKNDDGFGVSDHRTVMVESTDASAISTGDWMLQSGSKRVFNGTETAFSGYNVSVLKLSATEFYVADFMGGYYDQRAGYGPTYRMVGKFTLNADNSISLVESSIAGWGDSLTAMRNGSYDPATGLLTWEVDYVSGMTFYITLKLNV